MEKIMEFKTEDKKEDKILEKVCSKCGGKQFYTRYKGKIKIAHVCGKCGDTIPIDKK